MQSYFHYCLACGIKEIFESYSFSLQHGRTVPIDITNLRKVLASSHSKTGQFEMNYPGDSMEVLTAFLIFMHNNQIPSQNDSSNIECLPKCASHSLFELLVEETVQCKCGAKAKNKWDYCTFSHHFYVNDIFEDLSDIDPYGLLLLSENDDLTSIDFSSVMKCEGRLQQYIRNQWENSELKTCPSDCPNPLSTKQLKLLAAPQVFIVNMIWKDFRPDPLKILQVYASISYCISLDSIYHSQSPTIHVLKSIIYYGAGHYICAVRASDQKLWHKIDDESGKIIGEGTWKDLVIDSIKMGFYPVGLFYEESNAKENHQISPNDWMIIERNLLEKLKIDELESNGKTDIEWKCECGYENNFNWKICKKCNKIKTGIEGWACEKCTFINETSKYLCESCNSIRKTFDESFTCKCGKVYRNRNFKCPCENIESTCTTCGQVTRGTCPKCYTGYECKVCNQFISKSEWIICFRCKNKGTNKNCVKCNEFIHNRNFICQKCTNLLWKCNRCSLFNFPADNICVGNWCGGIKEREEAGKQNDAYLSQGLQKNKKEDVKNGENEEKCGFCMEKINKSHFRCVNCDLKTIRSICKLCNGKTIKNICDQCSHCTQVCNTCHRKFHLILKTCPNCTA